MGSSPLHALRFLAAAAQAKAVVEIGTGTGEAARWLLAGMAEDGVLTSIDVDPAVQSAAREQFAQAGIPPARTRLITGVAAEILPRLTEGGYDLVSVTATADCAQYLEPGLRLLRPGGVIVFTGVSGPHLTPALQEVHRAVAEDENLVPAHLPVGPGLLAAVKRGEAE